VKIEIKELSSTQSAMTITVDAETATKDYMAVLQNFRKLANIPGFRKGKAPMSMVENMYGDYAKEEFFNKKLNDYYRAALDEKDAHPVNAGEAQDFEWNKGEDMVVTFHYEVMPEIKVENFKGLEIPFEGREFEETMIDETLEHFRSQLATEEDAETVETGDVVSCTVAFLDDEDAVTKEVNRTIKIGDNVYSPKVDEALTGKTVGDVVKSVLFDSDATGTPEDDDMEDAITDRTFQLTITAIKRNTLPELNDDFAKDMEYDTLEDMKAKIAEQLKSELEQQNSSQRRDAIINALIEANPVELPASMVKSYAKSMAEPQAKQYKMKVEDIAPFFETMAEQNLKSYYMIDALLKQEEIEVTDEDITKTIQEAAANMKIEEEKYRELYKKQIESDDFTHAIQERKLLDMIAENGTFVALPEPPAEDAIEDAAEATETQAEDKE
jgi:trigger factor